MEQRLTLNVHRDEDQGWWAEVTELPGCFASGMTLDELVEAAREAVALYASKTGATAAVGEVASIQLMTTA